MEIRDMNNLSVHFEIVVFNPPHRRSTNTFMFHIAIYLLLSRENDRENAFCMRAKFNPTWPPQGVPGSENWLPDFCRNVSQIYCVTVHGLEQLD